MKRSLLFVLHSIAYSLSKNEPFPEKISIFLIPGLTGFPMDDRILVVRRY